MNERCGVREKTFSEELPYYWERVAEVFDSYKNSSGGEDPLHICVLRDSVRIIHKAREELRRSISVIEDKKCYIEHLEECVEQKEIAKIERKGIKKFVRKFKAELKKEASPQMYEFLAEMLDSLLKDMEVRK